MTEKSTNDYIRAKQISAQYANQLSNLRLENTDLWKKIESLEESLRKESIQVSNCLEESEEYQKSEEYYKRELVQFMIEVNKAVAATRASDQKLSDCHKEISLSVNKTESKEKEKEALLAETTTAYSAAQVELANCEKTLAALKERCARDAKELNELLSNQEKIKKNEAVCSGKLKITTVEKENLEQLKLGYDMLVQELETNQKKMKDANNRCNQEAKSAIDGRQEVNYWTAT